MFTPGDIALVGAAGALGGAALTQLLTGIRESRSAKAAASRSELIELQDAVVAARSAGLVLSRALKLDPTPTETQLGLFESAFLVVDVAVERVRHDRTRADARSWIKTARPWFLDDPTVTAAQEDTAFKKFLASSGKKLRG